MTTNASVRLDGLLAGLAIKVPARAVATSEITLSGEQTVNGVDIVAGDRVLVAGQSDSKENGIYDASTSAWSRSKDFDGNRDVTNGTLVPVKDGSDASVYYETTTSTSAVVFGTTEFTFSLVSFDTLGFLRNVVEDLTPQLGGALDANGKAINMADSKVDRPLLDDYSVVVEAIESASGAVTLDFEGGNVKRLTLDEDIDTITISNPPSAYGEMLIEVTQDGTGDWTVTGWPAAVKWPGGTAPTITAAAGSVDEIALRTYDGGTTYRASFVQDSQ